MTDWHDFYQKYFGLKLGHVAVPEPKEDFTRLIIVAKGLTLNRVYDASVKRFPCWRYASDDLDKLVTVNDRNPLSGHYAVLIRDRVEPDEAYKNKSADDLAKEGVKGITLLERMLLELKYFDETGNHLDVKSMTLCSGSRLSNGRVPFTLWCVTGLGLCSDNLTGSGEHLRCRETVAA